MKFSISTFSSANWDLTRWEKDDDWSEVRKIKSTELTQIFHEFSDFAPPSRELSNKISNFIISKQLSRN